MKKIVQSKTTSEETTLEMSKNEDISMDEATFEEEMNDSYVLETAVYDDNDEGTVEYLDLNLVVDSIPETIEECKPQLPLPKIKSTMPQPSVLKTNNSDANRPRRRSKRKQDEPPMTGHGCSTEIATDKNAASRKEKEKNENLASADLHAAVNAINARLADSARCVNGRGDDNPIGERTESQFALHAASEQDWNSLRIGKADVKSELDSLDLFFQSMAQTVLHLPSQVQAKIKMDICKVIAMAEIKYNSADDVSGK